jgi:hypothetical protein
MKGKAYDFFTKKVAMDARSWRLKEFFEAMFNYCFPLDFRQEQKAKLRRTFQNQKTVDEWWQKKPGGLFGLISGPNYLTANGKDFPFTY